MRIQHNIAALNSYRQLGTNNNAVSKNLEKLSSGYRINRAGDDAAGLAISEKMRAQITGLETAQKNALDGISLVQTAEGALTEVHSMLNRMTELATQSANGTYSSEVDRENLQKEVATLKDEIDRISKSTNFNGIKLLDGSIGDAAGVNLGVGASGGGQNLDLGTGLITPSEVNEGKIIDGTPGQAAETNIYLSSSLQATANGTTATTTEFELTLGSAGKINVEINSGTATNNVAKVSVDQIVQEIMKGGPNANNKTISLPGTGGAQVTITLTADTDSGDGTVKTWDDVKDKYTLSYANSRLTIKANKAGDSSEGYKVGFTGITAASTKDKDAMTDQLQRELTPSSTAGPVDITLGEKGYTVAGEKSDPTKYETASAKFTFGTAASFNNKMIELEGVKYIFQDIQNKDDWTPEKDLPNGVKVIRYDSTKNDKDESGNIANAFATTVKNDHGDKFDVTIEDQNNIIIKESVAYGNKVLAENDKSMITDMNTVINVTPGVTLGSSSGNSTIDFGKELKAGSWIEINGKKYQFANDASEVTLGSKFVKFTEGDPNANAQALLDALSSDFPGATISGTKIDLGKNVKVDAGSKGLSLQVGDTSDSYQKVTVTVKRMDTDSLGIADVDISEVEGAEAAIGKLRNAINQVSATRGDLGAVQNRLEHTINNLGVTTENITAAESRIRDTDMAEEMMAYTKNNILVQAAQAMLAQANTVPQGVLQLLG